MPRERLSIGQHGKITVKKNATGNWVARTYYRDKRGIRRDITAQDTSKGRAQARLQAKLQRYVPYSEGLSPRSTMDTLINEWVEKEEKKSGRLTPTQRSSVKLVRQYFGDLLVQEVTYMVIEGMLDEQAKKKADQKGSGKGGIHSANACLIMLRRILDLAVSAEAMPYNIAKSVKVRREKTAREPRSLTMEELQGIRETVSDYAAKHKRAKSSAYLPIAIEILIGTGCRIGEALALKWENIDLDTGECLVAGTLKQTGEMQPYTKNGERRIIYLPTWLLDLLRQRREDYPHAAYVVCKENGSHVPYTTIRNAFKSSIDGKYTVGFHDFRRTVATWLDREAGSQQAALQLGHEGDKVTRKSYIERRGKADFSAILEGLGG